MSIAMQCDCGHAFRVKDESAGKRVRCSQCKSVLRVSKPVVEVEVEVDVEDDASEMLRAESPPPKRRNREPRDEDDDEADERISEKPTRRIKPVAPEKRASKPKRRRRERDDEGGYIPMLVVSPTIISGVLMMLGAIVWFVLGIALVDRIYFYPPILCCLGIAAIVRGLMGHED